MAVTGQGASIGIPLALLYDAEGVMITVESVQGDMYCGLLDQTDDMMNLHMKNVRRTDSEGDTVKLERMYMRGSMIKLIILPDILAHSPMFKRVLKFKTTKRRYIPQGAGTERTGLLAPGASRDQQQDLGPPGRRGGGGGGGGRNGGRQGGRDRHGGRYGGGGGGGFRR
ncbi:Small nuclear ribonucleoprotein Sm D3 [Hondaea fermentalgiana]|uniref:Small nuclear ribonucleoprotein Sm D3 n=1 Tax=Hondaea fermentalgiana TaxID=2315210 RepID=A0A2R5GIF9_9STRA|nr:Small nuclear ribonucleoprotein Sm D3 [Hondaea fermentalgiana]|eukprot:GBG30677.1 Small nuclear ribonucleoprotein Sm D3 [Hondaea fermentalgiana]